MSGILALSESIPVCPYPSFPSLASPMILSFELLSLYPKIPAKNSNGDSKEFPANLRFFSTILPNDLTVFPRSGHNRKGGRDRNE